MIINASVESESLVAFDRRRAARSGGPRRSANLGTRPSSSRRLRDARSWWSLGRETSWHLIPIRGHRSGPARRTSPGTWFPQGSPETAWCIISAAARVPPRLAVRAGGSGDVTATHRLWTSTNGFERHVAYLPGWASVLDEQRRRHRLLRKRQKRASWSTNSVWNVSARCMLRPYWRGRGCTTWTARGNTAVLAAKPEFEQLAVNALGDQQSV